MMYENDEVMKMNKIVKRLDPSRSQAQVMVESLKSEHFRACRFSRSNVCGSVA